MISVARAISILVLILCAPSMSFAKRVAFVVGINDYPKLNQAAQLKRAVNDAQAVADTFTDLGFEVTLSKNASRATFNEAWQVFLDSVNENDTAAIYFSGHGVEIEGQNFIIPSDIPPVSYGRQEQLKREAISVSELLLDLSKRNTAITLVILDACRNHPLAPEGAKSGVTSGGLADMKNAPVGTFIMYSAWAGQISLDRLPPPLTDPDPLNSVYTRKLLPLMRKPGLQLRDLAAQVRDEVYELAATASHSQTPAYYDGIRGKFCLAGCEAGQADAVRTPPVVSEGTRAAVAGVRTEVEPTQLDFEHYVQNKHLKGISIYSDPIQYFDKGLISRTDALKERRLFREKWPTQVYTLIPGSLTVRTALPNTYNVSFGYDYYLKSGKDVRSGKAKSDIVVKIANGGYEIERISVSAK